METIPEAKDGKASEWHTAQHQIGAVFAPTGVVFVHKGSHKRIPRHVDEAHHQKHEGGYLGIETIDVGVEEQEIHANGLVDKVLGQVSTTKPDAFEPA